MAENLWKVRQRKGMSVSQLAAKSGVPARLINEYEAGERSVRSMDMAKIAQALYVDEADIKMMSDPIPAAAMDAGPRPAPAGGPTTPQSSPRSGPAPFRPRPQAGAAAPRPGARPERDAKPMEAPKPPPPPQPARSSQVAHLEALAKRLGIEPGQLQTQAGKPLNELTRPEASKILGELQRRIREENPPRPKSEVERHRPYLPESVDAFELNYLTAVQQAGEHLTFALFDGRMVSGQLVGFSPYAITVREEGGDEVTLQKLAIAFYRKGTTE